MPDYKFYYFNVRGIGEPVRMVMHYGNIEFEDVRIEQKDWRNYKNKMPQGTVPVLSIDNGKIKLSQSTAIACYLARKVGLGGRNELEMARIDEALATYKDMYAKMADFNYSSGGLRGLDKDELYESQAKPITAQYFPLLVKMLKKHHMNFIASQKPTVADFFFAEWLYSVMGFRKELFDDYPELTDYVRRVHALPPLQDYLKNRPKSVW